MQARFPDYTYREPTLNPTSLTDRPADWEADAIDALRNKAGLRELVGEALNQPFVCTITAISERKSIDPGLLLGLPACLRLRPGPGAPRYVHGLARRFAALGLQAPDIYGYRMEVVPRLWFLSQSEDRRVFEDMTPAAILKLLLQESEIADHRLHVQDTDERSLTVRFDECTLAFLIRVVEEQGRFFAFQHSATSHTLTIADDAAGMPLLSVSPSMSDDGHAGTLAQWQAGRGTTSGDVPLGDFDVGELAMHGSTDNNFTDAGAALRRRYRWPAGAQRQKFR